MKFGEQEFTSIPLTADYIEETPNIWLDISVGKYQIVLCAPEVVAARNGNFWRRIASTSCIFRKRCQLIVIDDAHLIWAWQKFREEFLSLGALRANFSSTPLLVQSATLPPHIRTFVHKTLHLTKPTLLSVETIDRPKIALLVAPQLNPGDPLDELAPFIHEENMLPTIIYVDDKLDCKQLTVANRLRLKNIENIKLAKEIIRPFSSMCTPEYQAETIALVTKGICKIIYATASASNGIDFPGIRRIMQYGVDANLLDFCAWVQRMGRAGRCDDEQCLAIIFVPARYLLPRLPQAGTELEDEMGKFRDAVNTTGSELMGELYKIPQNPPKKRKDNAPKPNTDAAVTEAVQENRKRSPVQMMKDLDPMLLWYLNTSGCRRHLLLKYFADPKAEDCKVKEGFVYCDVCSRAKIPVIGGVRLRMTLTNYFSVKAATKKRKLSSNETLANTTHDHKNRAEAMLRNWRDILWKDYTKFPMNIYAPSSGLLDDQCLRKLAARAARVSSEDDIRSILGPSCGWESSMFKSYGMALHSKQAGHPCIPQILLV